MKEAKVKKPIFKRWWFWAIVVILFIGIITPKSDKTPTESEKPAIVEEPVKEETAKEEPVKEETEKEEPAEEETLTFILMDGEVGEYGKEVVYNKGTEFEEHEICYYIPAGTYLVSNLNDKGAGQVSVYSGEPVKNGEWEEFVMDDNCARPIVVMAGETKELEVKEGQFVVLSDDTTNIQFTMK